MTGGIGYFYDVEGDFRDKARLPGPPSCLVTCVVSARSQR